MSFPAPHTTPVSSLGLIVNRSCLLSDLLWWWYRLSAMPPLHLHFPSPLFLVTISKCAEAVHKHLFAWELAQHWNAYVWTCTVHFQTWYLASMPKVLKHFKQGQMWWIWNLFRLCKTVTFLNAPGSTAGVCSSFVDKHTCSNTFILIDSWLSH